jgi:phosphatidylserine decarboxylase
MSRIYKYILGALGLGYLFFNRNPERIITAGNNLVSPADGTIVDIKNNKIEIFIELLDVHYQRAPQGGIITSIIDMNRSYNLIELDTELDTASDTSMGVITIERWAGNLARTVITYVKLGQHVDKGDIIGRILLGSHTSITIPPDLTIKVVKDQHVIAGETIIAE